MKINVTCPTCQDTFLNAIRQTGARSGLVQNEKLPKSVIFDLKDDLFYNKQCLDGHSVHVVLEQQRFETLFDIGSCALEDGYTREAVLSFVGSVERFYEFWIRCVLRKHEVPEERFDGLWRYMSKQSERQLGAFAALYVREFKSTPKLLDTKLIELRNAVAHKGKSPSRNEALNFGETVIAVLKPQIAELNADCRETVRSVINELRLAAVAQGLKSHEFVKMKIRTVLQAQPEPEDTGDKRTLAEQLPDIRRMWPDWGARA